MKPNEKPIGFGISSILGVASALTAGVGGIIAAAAGNDVATVTAGSIGVLATITTMGGRYAQAITLIKYAAKRASPWIDAAQEALADDAVPDPEADSGSLM